MADAQEKERQRRARGNIGPSPLPEEAYRLCGEELGLLNPIRSQLDDKLRNACELFRVMTEQERAEFRMRVSLEGFYTLLTFAQRSSVFALRERSPQILASGMVAVSIVEAERTDYRDILLTLSLLYHAAARIGIDPDQAFHAAEQLAEPSVRDLLAGFVRGTAAHKDISKSWGYKEVNTEHGPGYVEWRFRDYNPTFDLLKAAVDIAMVVNKDKYRTVSLTLGANVPDAWLRAAGASDLGDTLKDAKGVAMVQARLQPQCHAQAAVQLLFAFLLELSKASSAERLLQIARASPPKGHCMLAVASGPLFCLIVARSFVMGVDSYESGDSLRRFEKPVAEILGSIQRSVSIDVNQPRLPL